nr:hypothetical protein [Vallitalea longa]
MNNVATNQIYTGARIYGKLKKIDMLLSNVIVDIDEKVQNKIEN